MRSVRLCAALAAALLLATGCSHQRRQSGPLQYPEARQGDVVDDYNGVKVADPYRWLEDPDSPETRAWIEAENELTQDYLKSVRQRKAIQDRLTEVWNYEKYGVPFKRGDHYFYMKNDGLQNQSVLYTVKGLDDEPRVLIDPNTFSADGTVALAGMGFTDDGSLVAYAKADGGSDWNTWYVRNVETGEDLPDTIEWAKFSGASWRKDNSGFYYSRYDAPAEGEKLQSKNEFQKLYFHRLGTPQAEDQLVYEDRDNPDYGFGGYVTDDGNYLIIVVNKGTERMNLLYYQDLRQEGAPVVKLIDNFDAQYSFIDNDGPTFWFNTDFDAPRGRVVAIDTGHPDRSNWKELVPETEDTLTSAGTINNQFILGYMRDAHDIVKFFDLDGSFARELDLPGIGSAGGFSGKRGDTETFYSYTSFSTPSTVYRYDCTSGQSTVFRKPDVDVNPDDYVTKQIFYTSKDGTRVPMFITHRRGMELNGKNPTLLYGYGGFNIPLTPYFSPSNLVWMEMGGVYAVANIRGGGEYGRAWHEAGMRKNRQNVFDDFIAAAEWLIDNNYTNSSKLAISGGSNGGLLVAACMVQRPDLYGAVLPAVGVLDMLRFNKFTIGWAWESDYGSPQNPDEFKVLYSYSPLHNLKPGTHYPAVLITTGDHDDRVVPAHSFKFAATLQADQAGSAPTLIRIETRAGHGAGKPTWMRIEEQADQWAFLVKTLDMKPKKI
ncbi:MAG TPA: prolyl oligopeptidase family serine peptidase [Phycisphaerae bacterium]|nr:S9 family peptidase [Phycisphaerales bacterium]HRX83728.1 prolyl oligopeptidase family serine peptidase [Phycisphaerae bacterium]